jgi:large subunit ribosomal protein L25
MAQSAIEAQSRTALGKKVKALRRAGITPIHVYGRGGDSLSLQANTYDLVRTITDAGFTTPITVKAGAEEHFVMVEKVHRHPVTELLLHVDLIRVSRTERIVAPVPLHFEGDALGAREEGAQFYEDHHTIDVEAIPTDIPNSIVVDISILTHSGAAIHAKDLKLPRNVSLAVDPETVVARIVHHGAALEEEEEAAEEAAEATEPTAEGEESKEE